MVLDCPSVGGRHRKRGRRPLLFPLRSYLYVPVPGFFFSLLTSLFLADPISLIHTIHQRGMRAGIAISPDTPSTAITDEIGNAADMLLVMTVYPGSGIHDCFLSGFL